MLSTGSGLGSGGVGWKGGDTMQSFTSGSNKLQDNSRQLAGFLSAASIGLAEPGHEQGDFR